MSEYTRILRIDRARWGHGCGQGILLDEPTGEMCCMGFDCLACGLKPEQIKNVGTPSYLTQARPIMATQAEVEQLVPHLIGRGGSENYFLVDSKLCTDLTEANDSEDIDDEQREMEIIRLYAEAGIKVEFYGTCRSDHHRPASEEDEEEI